MAEKLVIMMVNTDPANVKKWAPQFFRRVLLPRWNMKSKSSALQPPANFLKKASLKIFLSNWFWKIGL